MSEIQRGKADPINKAFKERKATLHYPENNRMAYVQFGDMRYYFDGGEAPRKKTYNTSKGELTQTILDYDGWERNLV